MSTHTTWAARNAAPSHRRIPHRSFPGAAGRAPSGAQPLTSPQTRHDNARTQAPTSWLRRVGRARGGATVVPKQMTRAAAPVYNGGDGLALWRVSARMVSAEGAARA